MAKSTALRNGTLESAWEAIRDGWHYTDVQLVQPYRLIVGVPLAIVGLLAMSRSMRALAALLTAGILFLVCVSGGDFYPQFRMGTLLLPLWFLLVVEGMRVLLLPIRSAAVATAAVLVPIAIMCQPTLAVASVTAAGPLSLAVLKPFTADRFAALARNVRHRPITVMEADIGNVAYFTDFAILDLGGLANLEVARNGYTADQFRHYVFEEMKPDVIHLRGIFGWHTNLPVAMMQRSYRPVDGQSTESYATGWWVRRDDVETRPSFPSAASGAAEIYAAVARACDADGGACHSDAALSRQALERADRLRREGAFAFAFEWYAAAWEADRRNVLALRGREDMRLPGLQGCANAPAAPSHLHASLSGSTVTLSWDPVESASAGYLIEARSSQGIPTSFDSAAPTLTVREVGREVYRVHVRARNRCGAGAASNELVVTVR